MKRVVLNGAVALFTVLFFLSGIHPAEEGPEDVKLNDFSHLPVKYEGRKKPIDTLARNLLTILSGKQSVRRESGEKVDAAEWLLDNIAGCTNAADYHVVRIENVDVLSSLGLEERKGFRYSYREMLPALSKIQTAAQAAFDKEDQQRDLYDRQIIKLSNKLYTYQSVLAAFEDPSSIPARQLMAVAQRYRRLENMSIPLILPPVQENDRWRPLMISLLAAHPSMSGAAHNHGVSVDPLAVHLGAALAAHRTGDAQEFNRQLSEYRAMVQDLNPEAFNKIPFEVFYNRFGAFMKSAQLYLLVFILSCFGWLFRREGLLSAGRVMMAAAFIPHTFAIVARVFLSGYPPVTNLYSSAIFIGWAAVAAGIIMEFGFRRGAGGIGNLSGSIAGFSTLLIAHFLAGDGDTMEQMRAVLDTRFWLATHVITITLGYMATFVAGAIGILYVLSGVFTRRLDEETEDGMNRMMYGTICFALLLSFVGTVLGGLWAD
ncbi:MAG TPA: hypothetical protein VIR77_02390, partial [Pontiella sp.]